MHNAHKTGFVPFLFVFFVASNFVFLNLFVALLLENFEYIWEGDYAIKEVDVESFQKSWDRTVTKEHNTTLNITHLWEFVDNLEGANSIVVQTDPFWHNRLLFELNYNADDVLAGSGEIEFHELLLALTRMRYGNSCLPFDKEVEAEATLKERHEQAALRLMGVFAGAWKIMRYPPSQYKTDAEIKRFRTAVVIARTWIIGFVIKNSRLSKHKSFHAQHVEETIRNHGRFAQLAHQIEDFHAEDSNEDGTYPSFDIQFPPILNEQERKHVHTVAEEFGLQHGSVGSGSERHIRVWRKGDHVDGKFREWRLGTPKAKELEERIYTYMAEPLGPDGKYPTEDLHFDSDLALVERKHIHTVAEEQHMGHGSVGSGTARHISVWRLEGHAPRDKTIE